MLLQHVDVEPFLFASPTLGWRFLGDIPKGDPPSWGLGVRLQRRNGGRGVYRPRNQIHDIATMHLRLCLNFL